MSNRRHSPPARKARGGSDGQTRSVRPPDVLRVRCVRARGGSRAGAVRLRPGKAEGERHPRWRASISRKRRARSWTTRRWRRRCAPTTTRCRPAARRQDRGARILSGRRGAGGLLASPPASIYSRRSRLVAIGAAIAARPASRASRPTSTRREGSGVSKGGHGRAAATAKMVREAPARALLEKAEKILGRKIESQTAAKCRCPPAGAATGAPPGAATAGGCC